MPHQVDIGIITIRDDEFQAVLDNFPDELGDGVHRGKFREYALRKASAGKVGDYSLAIVRLPEQGNGEALDAARDMLEDLEPSLLLVVGIAGGLPSDDLTLGDVVLSTRINDYTVEARKEGAEPQYAISGGPIPRKLQGGIANLAARRKDLGDWTAGLPPKPGVNWTEEGQLYGPDEWQRELRGKLERHHERSASRPPRFASGPIASSDRLIKEPVLLFPWIQTARNLLAVEMESAGVFRAARDRCLMLAIRALSDIVGLKRVEDWTKYAAESAAAFTRAYLRTCPIPPASALSPAPTGPAPAGSDSAPATTQNTLTIDGGHVEANNIVVGVQNIYNDASSRSLDALEKLVDNGLLDDASEQLDLLEKSRWGAMSPVEKFRHRKMQGRILVRRGQQWAGAARFDEAANFVPGDEKAQVLKVNALMLRDDISGAHELAGKLAALYPTLAAAKAAWITSASISTPPDDLLPKPWDGLDPAIASALAHRLLDAERAKEALEVLQRAHSPGVDLAYWSAYTVALLKYQDQLGGQHGPPELLTEALPALEKALKLCVGESLKEAKVQILLNMGYVHRLRDDKDEEWRVLREALAIDPKHQDVRIRMAKLLTERGRTGEAIGIFEELVEDGPDYVPFLMGVALAKRNTGTDRQRAAELFEQTATIASPSEPALLLDGAEGLVKVCCSLKEWDRALAACARFADILGAFRAKELSARICLERGDAASAQRHLIEAVAAPKTSDEQKTLGVLFHHAGDNDRAVEQLEHVAPWNEWTESTAVLLNASQATGRDELTIRICRRLRATGITRDSVIDAEATALFRRGELDVAIELVQQALAAQENPFLRLRLSMLGVAAGRQDLVERDPSRLPQLGDGDPHVAVAVVGVLRAAREDAAALRYAYDTYRANRSEPGGWAAILEAFKPTRGPVDHSEPDVVTVHSSALIREGSQRRWITVEPDNPDAAHDELPPDVPLVVAMLGKRVGESFAVQRNFAPPRTYVIDEIRSKYVRAYHRCLEQWEEQFPHVPGPMMIEIPENLAEDIEELTKQLLPLLQASTKRVEEMERLYQERPITFHMLAQGLRCSLFGAMSHLMAARDLDVRCTRSNQDEIQQVLATLEGGKKVIVETTAISTLLLVDETDVLGGLVGRLAVARATLDELRAHRREVETRGEGYLGLHAGQLRLREIDEDGRARYLTQIDQLLSSLVRCDVFHEQEHDLVTAADWDRLVNIGGAGAVESLHRAMRTGEPIWCDDMVLALVANQRGVRVAWTQLMCHHLMMRSELQGERGCRISAKLVGAGFVSTNVNPNIYSEAARLAAWNPDHWPLIQHLRLLEVAEWPDATTGLLAVATVREWWRHAPTDATANAVMVALLDRIALRPNGMDVLIPAISGALERAFGVDVLSYERARATFEGWRRARPLRQGLLR